MGQLNDVDMANAKKLIIDFMHWKQGILRERLNKKYDKEEMKDWSYVKKEDEENINKMDLRTITKIIKTFSRVGKGDLSRDIRQAVIYDICICPFCIEDDTEPEDENSCMECTYKENHGQCTWTGSDYDKIVRIGQYMSTIVTPEKIEEYLNTHFKDLFEKISA